MRLLAPQRIRELLDLTEKAGFKRTDFTVEARESHVAKGEMVNAIYHVNSEYYFAFEFRILPRPRPGVLLNCVQFSPGSDRLVENSPPITDWNGHLVLFARWLGILKRELQHSLAGGQIDFTKEERVQIYYLVHDLLDIKRTWPIALEDPEAIMAELEEALKRQLSRLSIGDGSPDSVIKSFIMTAPYAEILTMFQVLPLVPLMVFERHRMPFNRHNLQSEFIRISEQMPGVINAFLELTASPARFSENGELQRESISIAVPQALLSLPGREILFRDVQIATHGGKIAAVIFIDLDGFKAVNDTLGHANGDKCLEKVAELLGIVAVGRGKVYRYGGDEFVLLFVNATTAEAAATGERIRSVIEAENVGGVVKVTTSIGVIGTDFLQTGTAQELVDAADKAAYVSKSDGKNRVTVGPPAS
jgi:diguanylate cyclase (GGDEF)-like protein